MDKCSSPSLFAAFHVLHRLQVPRHSPHALSSLTIKLVHKQSRFQDRRKAIKRLNSAVNKYGLLLAYLLIFLQLVDFLHVFSCQISGSFDIAVENKTFS